MLRKFDSERLASSYREVEYDEAHFSVLAKYITNLKCSPVSRRKAVFALSVVVPNRLAGTLEQLIRR
ncbi:MAG: hypothetical protein AAGG48_17450 [Planctomycetota bacterium]